VTKEAVMHKSSRAALASCLATLTFIAQAAERTPAGPSPEAFSPQGAKTGPSFEGRKRELRRKREEEKKREMQEEKAKTRGQNSTKDRSESMDICEPNASTLSTAKNGGIASL
jgi:hypothetical protein